MTANPPATFAFSAQDAEGDPFTGSIDARSAEDANQKLQTLNLRAIQLDPTERTPNKNKRLSGYDFQAFNTQLAYLATAGLPIEPSLRLIAQDMRTGPLSQTVNQVANDLEAGRSLPEAFAAHATKFPPLYSELVNAGIRTGNLPAMLLGLSRHIDMTQRLRGLLWKAAAYPIMVLASLLLVISFIGLCVLPQFKLIFLDFKVELPIITQSLINFSDFLVADWPILLVLLIVICLGPPIIFKLIKSPLQKQHIKEMFLAPLPIVGPALKQNMLARWCDALKLGIDAGLDLPAAVRLAGDAVGSPRLIADGNILIQTLNAGQPLDGKIRTRWIPPTLILVIGLAARNNDLPNGLTTLSSMFQQGAETRMATIPALITPVLIVLIACIIGYVVVAMFAPMIALISAVSGPQKN